MHYTGTTRVGKDGESEVNTSTGREPPSKAEPREGGEHAGRKATALEWQDAYSLIEPLMDNDGIYSWPFDSLFSVDVRFYRFNSATASGIRRISLTGGY